MTIGILYPGSAVYPSIGADFIDGLKALLQKEAPQPNLQLIPEGIGFGGAEKEVYSKAEKLLRIDKVDVLVAFVDLRVLPILEPLVYSLDKLLIVVNAGANYPYNWVSQPGTLYITLHHAFLCHLTGRLAAATLPAQAAVATSFYDCGYLHIAAMTNNFAAQGGQITYNFVHPQSYDPFDVSALTTFLANNPATNRLLCLLDELPASLLYQKLTAVPQAFTFQLFVSPMMLEEEALTALQEGAPFSVQGYRPWLPQSVSEANQSFIAAYRSFAKKEASLFALLGWETGLALQQVLLQANGETVGGAAAIEQLKGIAWQSPRGPVQVDDETHYLLAPAVQYTIQNGIISTQEVALSTVQEGWSVFSEKPAEGVSSGWTNTYLCY